MYNRYIPGSNGVYERKSVPQQVRTQPPVCDIEPVRPCEEKDTCPQVCNKPGSVSKGIDVGDLLLILIVLLLLMDSEEDDVLPLLITAAVFLFS